MEKAIFLLPVIFVMSGCTPFGGDSTLTTEQTQESTTDQTESEGENQKPQQPANPDHEADENEKPNEEKPTQPDSSELPDNDTPEPENPSNDENVTQPEEPTEPEEKPTKPDSSNKPDGDTPEPEKPSDDENVTQPEEPTEPEEKPTVPEVPGEDLTQPEKPNEGTIQPENPDGDMAEPEIPAEEEKPTQPEENQFFVVDFEVKCFDSTTAAIQKFDTPMSISTMYPDIQIQSNEGVLFFVDDYLNASQYAIHFKHSHEKEICTTLENGAQVLEFDIYYSIPFCQSTIFVNGIAVASLPFTVGFEKMTVRVEVFSNSTFTLDLTAIM